MSDNTPRLVVTAGSPTTEEVAAATAVLLGMAAGHSDSAAQPRRIPAWGRAARFEAVGQAPFTSSVDPRLQHRSSGALPPAAN